MQFYFTFLSVATASKFRETCFLGSQSVNFFHWAHRWTGTNDTWGCFICEVPIAAKLRFATVHFNVNATYVPFSVARP